MAQPVKGIFHTYTKTLTAFQFGEIGPSNALIFIGGLEDGFLTVPYTAPLAEQLIEQTQGQWTVVQILLTSSYKGWGTGLLKRDAKEISLLVSYLREQANFKKIAIMGHLTGCQDTIQYLTKTLEFPQLDAGIIQAPVSDREAFLMSKSAKEVEQLIAKIDDEYISQGKENTLVPKEYLKGFFNTPVSAYRFKSLFGERGDDDFFSSYLTLEDHKKTFGKVRTPLLVLYSGSDEFVPISVDKQSLVDQWKSVTDPTFWSPLSRVVKGATHNVGPKSEPGAETEVIEIVIEFIKSL